VIAWFVREVFDRAILALDGTQPGNRVDDHPGAFRQAARAHHLITTSVTRRPSYAPLPGGTAVLEHFSGTQFVALACSPVRDVAVAARAVQAPPPLR
jgi:hypothetical protein